MREPSDVPQIGWPGGHAWPATGLGTYGFGEDRGAQARDLRALGLALDIGWRAFDTAEMYADGGAERLLGEAIATALRGPLRREQLFITSKVYPHHAGAHDMLAACERSLRRLKLDQIDLYLLHWRGAVPLAETIGGFEALQQRGWIRHWGVSNFDVADMEELFALSGGNACVTNQVWYSLSQRGVEFDLLPWQRARGLPLMAYSPVDKGALSKSPKLRALATARGVTPAQLALTWLAAQPGVMALPKSADEGRLRQNLQAASLRLNAAEHAELDHLFPPPRRQQPLAMG